jgi:hypothetical protein
MAITRGRLDFFLDELCVASPESRCRNIAENLARPLNLDFWIGLESKVRAWQRCDAAKAANRPSEQFYAISVRPGTFSKKDVYVPYGLNAISKMNDPLSAQP